MTRHTFRICVVLSLSVTAAVVAQAPTDAAISTKETAPPPKDAAARPSIDVNETIRAARRLLDELDAGEAVDPDDAKLQEVRGLIQAIQDVEPQNHSLDFLRGRLLALLGRGRDASQLLLKFIETRDGRSDWQAYRVLGDLFVDEFPRLAKSNYQEAAKLNPREPSVLFGLSRCELQLGNNDEAVKLARQVVEADGRSTIRYVAHLAAALKTARQWDDALRESQRAVALALRRLDEDPTSLQRLLVVDEQYRLLLSILQTRINLPSFATARDFLRLATYVRQHARIQEKITLHRLLQVIRTGVDQAPDNPPVPLLLEYGDLLADLGFKAEAIDAFERVLKADPSNKRAAERLSQLRTVSADTNPAK